MHARLVHKKSGQSIPLIALMLVVVLGMVGLSVDVGNTYAEQRSAVRATNAAALAGMSTLIAGGDDQAVANTISASLQSNNIKVAVGNDTSAEPGLRVVEAHYMGPDGTYLSDCWIGRCNVVPPGVAYIQVKLSGTVSTYFARVVGRDTLPVSANAFSAQCLPINGVYPIAIKNSDLDANGWVEWDGVKNGTYSDSNIQNKTMRRIYLNEDNKSSERFSLLQWSASNNGIDAFQDAGTLGRDFEEVTPWPDTNTTAPANYPLAPKQVTLGDWIQGNSNGGVNWASVRAALDQQRAAKTVLTLPIYDGTVESGSTSAFHLARLGQFYVHSVGGANDKYIELVYIGEVKGTSCLQTNVEPPTGVNCPPDDPTCIPPPPIRVLGQAFVKPRWKEPNTDLPISYQVILDVSGSMSLDFFGLGTLKDGSNTVTHYKNPSKDSTGGKDWWCSDWYNPDAPPSNNSYTKKFDCQAGQDNAVWRKYQDRRIYVAKSAVKALITQLSDQDTMRIIAFSTSQSNGAKPFPSSGWSGDQAVLTTAVEDAGTYNSDPYRTSGGTPGAQALQATRNLLNASNKPQRSPDGRKYKNVIIYLTDGMANVFLDGSGNDGQYKCPGMNQEQTKSTAKCQIGQLPSGKLLPITAMIDQADKIKAEHDDIVIYTIGMAGVDPAGLPQVATSPSTSYTANQPGVLNSILFDIKGQVSEACQENGLSGAVAVGKVKPQNFANDLPAPNTLSGDVYGYVYLYDDKGQPLPDNLYRHPITQEKTGHLSWEMPEGTGLAPGSYKMSAWIGYKSEQDDRSRIYTKIEDRNNDLRPNDMVTFTVSYKDVLSDELIVPAVTLVLNGDVCAR